MSLRIVHAPGIAPLDESFLRESCERAWRDAGERPRGIVRLTCPSGRPLALKVGRGTRSRRLVRRLLCGPSRSAAAFELAEHFRECAIPTPLARSTVERADPFGVVHEDALVCDYVDARPLDVALRREPEASLDWIGRCALLVHRMHGAGVLHRDLKASNLLVRAREADEPILVTDLDGASRVRGVPSIEARSRDLGRLALSLEVLGADADALLPKYGECAGWSETDLEFAQQCVDRYRLRKRAQNERRGRELR